MNTIHIGAKLKLSTPKTVIRRKIMYGILQQVYRRLLLVKGTLVKEAKRLLERSLRNQQEFDEMVSHDGRLRKELGVADSSSAMESLVQAWINSVHVIFNIPSMRGSRINDVVLSIRAIEASYNDVISQAWAWYHTKGLEKSSSGDDVPIQVPWLEWLLLRGHEFIVMDHIRVTDPKHAPWSRTDTNTIMIKSKGKAWGVPSEYAGDHENNYATRAVQEALPDISRMFKREVLKVC
jgi:hypothetical protein